MQFYLWTFSFISIGTALIFILSSDKEHVIQKGAYSFTFLFQLLGFILWASSIVQSLFV